MATSDPVEILLEHNMWATRTMIQACESLTDEQFHQKFEMGPGSLHDTLTHMIGAIRGWGDLLAGREQRARLEGDKHSIDELNQLLEEVGTDFSASARNHPVDEEVTGERGGRSFTFTRGGVITHVTTHGMHHRAQCLNMLRQLGVDPLPPSAVVEWILMVDGR
jgi:uncharacterized damage-inducible protein DinB